MDPSDIKRLAHQFMINAVKVKPGDNIWIEHQGPKGLPIALACVEEVEAVGGHAHVVDSGAAAVNRDVGPLDEAGIKAYGEAQLDAMKPMQGYIRIKDDDDQSQIALTDEQRAQWKRAMRPMIDYRVNNTRWLVTAAPTEEFAAACRMDFAEFEQFYRDVCLANYPAMDAAAQPLAGIMDDKEVHIYSPGQGTDLTFRTIKGKGIPCTGTLNIPDGECFTAPVKDSINGTIKFGPSAYDGQRFQFIKLTFKNGHIESAEAENEERTAMLNKMLDTDDGARFVGEFAINFNPYIKHPTGSILFDEKIDGGIHLAMGACYDEAPNGNKSAVHWDMVHIQRPDYGGGELYVDGRLIRKDGVFVVPELLALNPENLKAATPKPGPA